MRTGDPGGIRGETFPRIPHYNPELILSTLADPTVQPLLPGPLRRDLVRDRQPSLLPFVHDGPLSLIAVRAMRSGPWFCAAGVLMLAAGALRARRRTAAPGA
jgi:hypothetical protein